MRICVSDAGPLTPQRDAGSRATCDVIETLESLGHEVICRPVSEVETLTGFDLFVASRPGPALHALKLPGFKETPSVFFGHDLHFQRMSSILGEDKVEAFRRSELVCWRAYDVTVYPSTQEADYVNSTLGESRAIHAPIFMMGDTESSAVPKTSEPSCVFVGSAIHEPNQDAVERLVDSLWPQIHASSSARLHLVGEWSLPDDLKEQLSISIHSNLSERDLNGIVASSWLLLAPLSFGAGVKRKVIHALHCGTPVVGTEVAFQGLEKPDGGVWGGVQADDADSTVARTVELLRDNATRTNTAREGHEWVQSRYSREALRERWFEILKKAQRGSELTRDGVEVKG